MSFLLSFVLWSFQVLGKDLMDYGIRSGKSLSLGMPKAPQGNIQGPEGIPSFVFNPSVNLLEAIFLFTTWYVFCLERLVLFESLLFSLPQSSLLYTPFWERHAWIVNLLEYSMCFTYIFWARQFALVLHLYLFRARRWLYFIEIVELSCFTYIIFRVSKQHGNLLRLWI